MEEQLQRLHEEYAADRAAADLDAFRRQRRDRRNATLAGGMIGIVLTRIPALGRINGNVYYCQGYSGHGVNATHIMGELAADAIGGTMEKFDLFANMRHFRIPGSQWMGNQIIALGMLYFRLKDML